MSEVDLIVVHDHKLAEQIVAALKRAGIRHVEFWPEQTLRPGRAYSGALLRGGSRAKKVSDKGFGPFHIRVREEDLAQARLVLSTSGLTES
jgi:chromosome segregation ATPase